MANENLIRRGTTPQISITIDNFDLSTAKNIFVNIIKDHQKYTVREYTGNDVDIDGSTINVYLDRDETLEYTRHGNAQLQVTIQDNGDLWYTTDIYELGVYDTLKET